MRKSTFLWITLTVFCGVSLFHTSQQVQDNQTRLAIIKNDIGKEEETIRVLQAEWSYLNQPDRLAKLSKAYLKLSPLKISQFIAADKLPDRPDPALVAAVPKKAPVTTPVKEIAKNTPAHKPVVVTTFAPTELPKTKPAATPKAAKPAVAEATPKKTTPPKKFDDLIKSLETSQP